MRLPWRRDPAPPDEIAELAEEAQRQHQHAAAQHQEARSVAGWLRRLRMENHFGPRFDEEFKQRRGEL